MKFTEAKLETAFRQIAAKANESNVLRVFVKESEWGF
jgi:hypothetical protein